MNPPEGLGGLTHMSPSTSTRRAGIVTASALALSLGGAFTAGAAAGATLCPVGQIVSSTGQCVKKSVGSVVPAPTATSGSSSSSSGGGSVPVPSVPKLPLPTGGSSGSSGGGGSSSSGGSSGVQVPSLPKGGG